MAEASHTRKVLALLEARGEARVGEMAEALGVDPTTVRRALRRLEQMGLVERTWGGAKLFQAVRYVGEMARGDGENPEAKHRIAVKAASLVKPHMALGISGGTTCTKVARLLRGKPLEVYTNAANIAVELFSYPKTRVFLLPGRLNLFSYEAVGEETVRYVESLPALDLLLVGASAIGPKGFYSPHRLGAQPPFPLPPDQEVAQGLLSLAPVRVVTLAPELPGALGLIRFLAERGVRVQLGHTEAGYGEALSALEAGAVGFTHLYNAMTGLHHRSPGVVGLALERGAWAEIIPDGLHVHPAALRLALRAIPGLYGVSDAVAAAGMPDGVYPLGAHRVEKRGEGVWLGESLAGSTLTLDRALRNLVAWGLPLEEASRRLSLYPARYLGLSDRGEIALGKRADLVVLDEALRVVEVYLEGERVA